jgi:hypothetical protein
MIAAIYARLVLATLGLLACATSASAECAWVLWVRPEYWVSNDIEARNEGAWEPRAGYMTLPDCEAERRVHESSNKAVEATCRRSGEQPRGVKVSGASMPVHCLPDAVDPRGSKGK